MAFFRCFPVVFFGGWGVVGVVVGEGDDGGAVAFFGGDHLLGLEDLEVLADFGVGPGPAVGEVADGGDEGAALEVDGDAFDEAGGGLVSGGADEVEPGFGAGVFAGFFPEVVGEVVAGEAEEGGERGMRRVEVDSLAPARLSPAPAGAALRALFPEPSQGSGDGMRGGGL